MDFCVKKGCRTQVITCTSLFSLPAKEAFLLEKGGQISEAAVKDFKQREFSAACQCALNILSGAPVSAKRLEARLQQKGYTQPAAEAARERMQQLGYINDSYLADRIVEIETSSGPARLRNKLYSLGISAAAASEALSSLTPENQLGRARLAAQRFLRNSSLPPEEKKMKLHAYLKRRGFSWDILSEVLPDD